MNKPDTALHEKSYADDWIAWMKWWIQENKYTTLADALTGIMRETRGCLPPKFVGFAWDDLKGEKSESI